MSGPYEQHMDVPPLDRYERGYPVYESHPGTFHGMPGAPMPYEGYAFWYRPEPQETIYQQDTSQFSPGLPLTAPPIPDQSATVKHRRTRSGCFTCRNRRVKCDETRPICDRCRKGNRECEFPQNTSSSKRAKLGDHKATTENLAEKDERRMSTIRDESEEEDDTNLEEANAGEDEQRRMSVPGTRSNRPNLARMRTKSVQGTSRSSRQRKQSDGSVITQDKASSPSSDVSDLETPQSAVDNEPASPSQRWRQLKPKLKPEVEKYLRFQHTHMTYYHYILKLDPDDFIHTELIDLALQFEPLLYAVVAYAAYHYTFQLQETDADFSSFWKYYSKSIVKLRRWLETNDERNDVVLLTVLQLAMFEEFLGDWTNLAAHHRAAYGILTTRYTPQSIMETSRGRMIFDWYTHFDVISALMAVRDTVLDRSWLEYAAEWRQSRARSAETQSIPVMIAHFGAQISLTGRDVAFVFAAANTALAKIEGGQHVDFSIDDVIEQVNQLLERLDSLRCEIQALHHTSTTGADEAILPSEDEVFPVSIPLFRGASWPLNFVWIDWYGIMEMLKYQLHVAVQKARILQSEDEELTSTEREWQERSNMPEELGNYSQIQCSIYSAIKRSPTAPEGAILGCHASVGLSVVFLPRLPKYTMWARKQLALFEQMGYIWPPSMRKEMAQLWNIPEVEDWWLPNGEGKSRLLSEIRMVVADRMRAVSEHMKRTGQDDGKSDLRDIKGLFEKMSVGRRSSTDASLDISSYVNMAHAASMVSSPENSSASSGPAFSPRAITGTADAGDLSKQTAAAGSSSSRSRQQSWGSLGGNMVESPTTLSKPTPGFRMSGIWEEEK